MHDAAMIARLLTDPTAEGRQRLTRERVGRALLDLGIEPTKDGDRLVYDLVAVQDRLRRYIAAQWPDVLLRPLALQPPAENALTVHSERLPTIDKPPADGPRQWSHYQTAIFDEMAEGSGNLIVQARAGSGKTTSLIEGVDRMPRNHVLLCAFNKSIQIELEKRAPADVMVRTLHALGLRMHASRQGKPVVESNKAGKIAETVLRGDPGYAAVLAETKNGRLLPLGNLRASVAAVKRLTSLAKNTLTDDEVGIAELAENFAVGERRQFPLDLLVRATLATLDQCVNDVATIDFDDMIWFPYQYDYDGGRYLTFDTVLVDEAQDLNAAQIWMVQRLCANRMIGFCDDRQAIYRFRGADHHAISKLIGDTNAKTLPLSISYRCAVNVVEQARRVCPDIEPAPNAPSGHVEMVGYREMLADVMAGDYVLSRVNAPLIRICLDVLRRHIPANVAGRDLAQQLRTLIDSLKVTAVPAMRIELRKWLDEERARHMPDHPQRYEAQCDKAACLMTLADGLHTVQQLKQRLDSIFSDDQLDNVVLCSSVHKAKGMERERVWMLSDSFGFPHAKPWQDRTEEQNIWYVAVTRAKTSLFFVETPISEISGTESGL